MSDEFHWKAPEVEVTIGAITQRGTAESLIVEASRSQPVAGARLILSNVRFEWEDGANNGDALALKWGWQGEDLDPLFTGSVKRSFLREKLLVWGLCRARQLTDTRIARTYKNEAAHAIVAHLISGLDFANSDIYAESSMIERLPLADHSIAQAIRALGFDYATYCDALGGFHWGPPNENQIAAATFTHGEDVVDFSPLSPGRYLLKVFPTPLWHSQVLRLVDPDADTTTRYFIEALRHTVGQGAAGGRSQFWLRELA